MDSDDSQYEQWIVKDRLDGFLKYFSKGTETVEATFKKASQEVQLALDILLAEYHSGSSFLAIGCSTLFDTWAETTYDIESSIYLAFSGRYASANAILRRVFEIKLISLYFDTQLTASCDKSQVEAQLEDWMLNGHEPLKIVANRGIIDSVFSNNGSVQIEIGGETYAADREEAKSLYGALSEFVHKSPPMPEEHLLQLDFADFHGSDFSAWLENLRQVQRKFVVLLVHHFPDFVKHFGDEQEKVDPQDQSEIIH